MERGREMGRVRAIAFEGSHAGWEEAVGSACDRWLSDHRSVTAVAGVTATGRAMRKAVMLPGVAVLHPGGLEVWHRSAFLKGSEAGRHCQLRSEDVAACGIGRQNGRVELAVTDDAGQSLVTLAFTAAEEGQGTVVESALRGWARREGLPTEDIAIRTLRDKAAAAVDEARDLAQGPLRERTTTAVGNVRERAQGTVDTLTLREFREQMDAAMGQVVEVLTVHEAEIARLQQRVAELSEELAQRSPEAERP